MTREEVIAILREQRSITIQNDGRNVELERGTRSRSGKFVQYERRYPKNRSAAVHYEVVVSSDCGKNERPRRQGMLDVGLHIEDDTQPKSFMQSLRSRISGVVSADERFVLFNNGRWAHVKEQIDCTKLSNRDDAIKKAQEALQLLYDKFEPIINEVASGFNGAENPDAEGKDKQMHLTNKIKQLLDANLQVILTGAPGTGKTFVSKQVAEDLVCEGITDHSEKQNAIRERIQSVQFHPGYDYSDFVIGLKPVLVSESGKEVFCDEQGGLFTTNNGKKDGERERFSGEPKVSFFWKDGIFKQFADNAKKAYDAAEVKVNAPKFVFLIDEINRTDLSRVFGELFSQLECDYRYSGSKVGNGIMLPNGVTLVVPKNLYIIGTMNDIDRSVDSMDFALRRRFAWLEIRPEDTDEEILKNHVNKGELKEMMTRVNKVICEPDTRLGPEYQLGAAIFAKCDGDNYQALWDNHIGMTLREYLRGRNDRQLIMDKLEQAYKGTGQAQPLT